MTPVLVYSGLKRKRRERESRVRGSGGGNIQHENKDRSQRSGRTLGTSQRARTAHVQRVGFFSALVPKAKVASSQRQRHKKKKKDPVWALPLKSQRLQASAIPVEYV